MSPREAMRLQERWRRRVRLRDERRAFRTVAGVDVGVRADEACAALVLCSFPELETLESAWHRQAIEFPYVPGLLGFREVPCILAAYAKLTRKPDLLLVDGHGIAHPRRFGVASHLGIELDLPSVGCAKSVLVGTYRAPASRRGSSTRLRDGEEVIGRVVRTRSGVNPVFVSPGHRISLESAESLVLRCARGYRLPEPIRAAHALAASHG